MAGSKPFTGGISAAPCPTEGCTCGTVAVRFHDFAGQTVTGLVLPNEGARLFLAQLSEAVEGRTMDASTPAALLRCEGTA